MSPRGPAEINVALVKKKTSRYSVIAYSYVMISNFSLELPLPMKLGH